jgi:arylsulfatase A-like enzyme
MNVPFLIRYPGKLKPQVNDVLLGTPDIMPTLLSLAGLEKEIPALVQGQSLTPFLKAASCKRDAPKGVLYIRNVDGEKDSAGKVQSYFPIARGIKTHRYTMAITIDRQKQVKEILLFDDKKDPYQMQPLDADKNKKIFKQLTKEMGKLLKKADDPWYKEKVLPAIISYDN